MKTSYSVLLNGQAHPQPGAVPVSGQAIVTPRIQAARAAKEVVWTVLVERLDGAPTTAGLYMAFQGGVRTTRGADTPPAGVGGGVGTNRYNFTDVAQQWFTLNADRDAAFLPDGDFPPTVADQTMSAGTLSDAIAVGDKTIRCSQQYEPGQALMIENEQFHVVGAATTADSGATWTHPVVSGGAPDATSSINLQKGWAARAHVAGTAVHASRVFFKRVLGGFDQRLLIVPTFTGGTNPKFQLSIDVRGRG
ncbi:hypothetical protein [Patulibacter sp. SYSU D01012]|uniref:hypothetical protein n=1 Tax=Patulibacter sp. SYSU D01012 TaxID=2817381 RepID=UPI001B3049FE|nr:hypothetical protein [Patulibacter sp. SYSU D01012]